MISKALEEYLKTMYILKKQTGVIEAYDIVYLFLKDVLNLDEQDAEQEAENIKSSISDNTLNKLAKYVHKTLDLSNLDCDYDINNERCRSCVRRRVN